MDFVCLTTVILCLHSSCFTFWHLWHSLSLTGFCFTSCSHLQLLNGAGENPDFCRVPNSSNQICLCRFGFGFCFCLMKIVIPALLTVILVIFAKFLLPFFHSLPRSFFCFQCPVVQVHFAAFFNYLICCPVYGLCHRICPLYFTGFFWSHIQNY